MKRIITLVLLMHAFLVGAQNQILGFNYQAVARNNSGQLLVNQKVSFKFNFIQGSISNQPIYTETHDVVTDDLGQVNMVMGNGTPVLGAFDKIDWSKSPYFLGIEMNTGNGFNAMGTTQFMSVPYAKYAETSGNASGIPNGSVFGEMMFWDGKSWVTIAPGKVGENLVMCDKGPKWGSCELDNSTLPIIKLTEVTFLNETNVQVGVYIENDGGAPIESSGVCWKKIVKLFDSPTVNDSVKVSYSKEIGLRTLKITLKPNEEYYIRAFATNKNGITYEGDLIHYYYKPVLPELTTDLIADYNGTTAVCYGSITKDFGEAILESGIVWGESKSPTIDGGNKIKSSTLGIGSIAGKLTNLEVNKVYFARTYAINKNGVAYGTEQFLDTTVPDVVELTETGDGNVYFDQKYLKPTKIIYKNLVSINGYFYMNNAENVVSVEFPLLEKVNGYIFITGNNKLIKISAPKLASANSYVYVAGNSKLENLEMCSLKNIYCDNQSFGGQFPYVYMTNNNFLFDAKPSCINPVLEKPEIKLLPNVTVTNTTAICNFEIIKLCSGNPKIFWSTVSSINATPETVIESANISTVSGPVTLYNLTPKTTYYARVGVENGGSVYGNEISFTTN